MTHETNRNPADDPRLTAYALGELPAAERAEIEALLATDESARRFVEETRAFAAAFGADLASVPADAASSLTDAQRAAIRDRARGAPKGKVLRLTNWAVPATAAAAMLVGVTFAMRHEIGRWWIGGGRDVARATIPEQSVAAAASPAFQDEMVASSAARRDEPRAQSGPHRGPSGEVPPDSREPSDPPPTAAGPGAGSGKNAEVRLSELTEATGSDGEVGRLDRRQVLDALEEAREAAAGNPPANADPGAGVPPSDRPVALPVLRQGEKLPASGSLGSTRGFDLSKRDREMKPSQDPVAATSVERKKKGDSVRLRGFLEAPAGGTRGFSQDACADELLDGLSHGAPDLFTPATTANGAVTSWTLDLDSVPGVDADVLRIVATIRTRVVAHEITVEQAVQRLRSEVVRLERAREQTSREAYAAIHDNPFRTTADSPLSTFGVDVDTASYSNVRRFLREGQLPPPGAVRIEEMINSFRYSYQAPLNGDPFAVHTEVAGCPWNPEHRIVRIGLKGREVDLTERPNSNLVFLVDVSGSMQPANKLPLLIESMKLLAGTLDARDKVSIVVYAGAAGMVLPPTAGDQRATILGALDRLRAGGSTAGGAGIELAYKVAQENFVAGGVNRVILATDGDFNVGVSDESSLVRLIEEKAKSKVFLTVLGFGTGNLQDSKMEAIANKGNGNYAYVDSLKEGRKVLVEQAASTLMTIAKDVKLQVEFNPLRVASYRLIGYENRVLATEDFADDRKDAGDMGAGHTVTALYEIVPPTLTDASPGEPLRYQSGTPSAAAHSGELFTVKLRWKAPEGDVSALREIPVQDTTRGFDAASADFHLAASVASFGMLLRGSPHKGGANWDMAIELAQSAASAAPSEDRTELVDLIRRAKELSQ